MAVAVDFSPIGRIGDAFVEAAERDRDRELWSKLAPALVGVDDEAAAAPGAAPAAPVGPSFTPGGSRRVMTNPADAQIEQIALAKASDHVGANPFALAAFAAHGNAESSWSPSRIAGSWSDPSQTGKPGTSGGALSWRNERYTNMRQATAGAGSDPRSQVAAQTDFAFTENPALTARLREAKSLPEAFSMLAASQRYAGWNDPDSAENQKRLQLAQNYYQRITGGQGSAPAAGGPNVPPAPGQPQAAFPAGARALPDQSDGAKRQAIARMLQDPRSRAVGLQLLTQLRKDDSWTLVEHAGQKFWANGRTRQFLPSGLPAETVTQEPMADGRTANRLPN